MKDEPTIIRSNNNTLSSSWRKRYVICRDYNTKRIDGNNYYEQSVDKTCHGRNNHDHNHHNHNRKNTTGNPNFPVYGRWRAEASFRNDFPRGSL